MVFAMKISTDKNQLSLCEYIARTCLVRGPGSVVGITNVYLLDGPVIETRWGRDFPHLFRPALGPPSLLYNGYRGFPGVKSGRGVTLTPHRLLVKRKSSVRPLLPTVGLMTCTEPQCKYNGALYLYMSCSDTHRPPHTAHRTPHTAHHTPHTTHHTPHTLYHNTTEQHNQDLQFAAF
jgi:hypothetical protein